MTGAQFTSRDFQLSGLPLASFPGIPAQPGFGVGARHDPLVRLRMEQEAAALHHQQQSLLRQRLQQQSLSSPTGVYSNFPTFAHNAMLSPTHGSDALLQQQLRMAQEEALLQQHLQRQRQQRSQGMYTQSQPSLGMNLPSAPMAGQQHLLQAGQQQQTLGSQSDSLLAALLRQNSGPDGEATMFPAGHPKSPRGTNK